jgi:dihydrodipicolinate reductase
MAIKVALMGAGGKMGQRITDNMVKHPNRNEMAYIEVSEMGIANLAKRGLTTTPQGETLKGADVVILAAPDKLIDKDHP